MARRTQVVTIEQEGRDKGKQFLITEMDAEKAEWWAFRCLQALLAGNPDLGGSLDTSNQASLSVLATQAFSAMGKLDPMIAQPLLKEMMDCVQRQLPDGKNARGLLPDDIEEVATRIQLRKEVFILHTGFFDLGGV